MSLLYQPNALNEAVVLWRVILTEAAREGKDKVPVPRRKCLGDARDAVQDQGAMPSVMGCPSLSVLEFV